MYGRIAAKGNPGIYPCAFQYPGNTKAFSSETGHFYLKLDKMKPDYKKVQIKNSGSGKVLSSVGENPTGALPEPWITAEQIAVKPVFTKADLENMEHLSYA